MIALTDKNVKSLIDQLKLDEGFSPKAYWDNDQWTYGYGTKAPFEHATITESKAELELLHHIGTAAADYFEIFGNCPRCINDVRKEALVNMLFNLGSTKLRKFRKMIAAIDRLDWEAAADEAMDSLWFHQVGKRAVRIVRELRTGVK